MKIFLFTIILIAATFSWAHPHVYINATISAEFDNSGFTGVQNHWVFDEIYSAAMFAAADEDKNKDLSLQELAKLENAVLKPLEKYKYYNHVLYENKFLIPESIQKFNAKMESGKLVIDFFVTFTKPAKEEYTMFLIVVDDPSNYMQVKTDMAKANITAPKELEVDYFDDSLEGLAMMRSFRSEVRGLYLRFKKCI